MHEFPAHVHDSYTLGVVTRGERVICVNGVEHVIRAGEGFIIDPLMPHSCGPVSGTGHDYRILSLDASLMKAAARDVFGRDCLPSFPGIRLSQTTLIIRLINLLKKFDSGQASRDDLLPVLADVILQYADEVDPAAISESRRQLAWQARAFLDAHPERTVLLEELAAEVNVSPYYVDRVFRAVFGVPPHVYQLQSRVKRAADALLRTGSITEVAYNMGFADQSHFTRMFKRNVGVSPGRFLKTNKKADTPE